MEAVASHQSTAAGQLYRVLAEDNDNNVFLSPFSISTALTMVAAGTDGGTASQMQTALALPEDMTSLHEEYNKVLVKLQNPANVTLSTANKLYVQDSCQVLDSYTGLLKEQYLTEMKMVSFENAIEASKMINSDVEREMRGKIRDIIEPSSLDQNVRLVLVNVIYFKGTWKEKFNSRGTKERNFFVTPEHAVKTRMLFMRDVKFNCGPIPELGCKVLEMPYEGDRFSMLILLPDRRDGLKDLESKLPSLAIRDIRESLTNQEPIVIMPKFKLETSYDLVKPLQKLGIIDLFDKSADLSKISGDKNLFVSKVVHKAFLEVNEEGAEAAAATADISIACSAPYPFASPFRFIADHPFFFVIFDIETGLTLFSGRYVKPA